MTKIIGISAFYHDSAVALVVDGQIKFAAQEERFSRVKNDANFPKLSLEKLLKSNKIKIDDIDAVVFFEKPFLKFERLIETYLGFAPLGFRQFLKSMPIWLNEKLFMKRMIINHIKQFSKKFDEKKIFFQNTILAMLLVHSFHPPLRMP